MNKLLALVLMAALFVGCSASPEPTTTTEEPTTTTVPAIVTTTLPDLYTYEALDDEFFGFVFFEGYTNPLLEYLTDEEILDYGWGTCVILTSLSYGDMIDVWWQEAANKFAVDGDEGNWIVAETAEVIAQAAVLSFCPQYAEDASAYYLQADV